MAFADASTRGAEPVTQPVDDRPFGLSWAVAVLCSAFLFIWCRASVRDGVSIDEIEYWIVGAAPFVAFLLGRRLLLWRSPTYLEIWMLSLVAFLIFQIFDVAHFIEYPLYLRVDVGLSRNFASAFVYTALGSVLWFACSFLGSRSLRTPVPHFLLAAMLTCGTLALGLFQYY